MKNLEMQGVALPRTLPASTQNAFLMLLSQTKMTKLKRRNVNQFEMRRKQNK